MAGIYIHIPFCKTRCLYCDFFSDIHTQRKNEYVNALIREIENRKSYLGNEIIKTLYFGGGTPSQLEENDFEKIFNKLQATFDFSNSEEITIEANPEDLTPGYIEMLRRFPFNRISIGVQSFHDDELRFLNRRHNAQRAIDAVWNCYHSGFKNISIDLMYGLPNQTIHSWDSNLTTALSLPITHISSYHLIYEEGTAMYRMLESGKINSIDEELSLDMFKLLIHRLKMAEFLQYEISNFAKKGYISLHNSSYWKGEIYLGLGPGAHSFDGNDRHSNLGNLDKYIIGPPEPIVEHLTKEEHYNDFILTSLRTYWGIDTIKVKELFGEKLYNYCMSMARPHLKSGGLQEINGHLSLTENGIFISDGIMSDFMWVDEN